MSDTGNQVTTENYEHLRQFVDLAVKSGMNEKNMIAFGRSPKVYLFDKRRYLTPEPQGTLDMLNRGIDRLSLDARLGIIQSARISAARSILVAAETKLKWTVPALTDSGEPIKILQQIGSGRKEGLLRVGHIIKIEDINKPIPVFQRQEVKEALMHLTFHVSYTHEQVCGCLQSFETATTRGLPVLNLTT